MSFNHGIFTTWMTNSLIVAIGGSALAVFTAIPAGYALAMLRFRGRRVLRFITLLTMVMPNTVLVIPLFLEVSAVGGIGQLWPVIVIMGFYPFGVYLAYIHFLTTLPRELVEAARIDGLSEVMVFLRIAVPDLQAGGRAGHLLQLRGQLDQLLPAPRAAATLRAGDRLAGPPAAGRVEPDVRSDDRPPDSRPSSTCRSWPLPRRSRSCRCCSCSSGPSASSCAGAVVGAVKG